MKLTEQRMECATCHRVFNGLTNFDKHRTSNYDDPTAPKCVHPSCRDYCPEHRTDKQEGKA